ncbi:signal peptide protein [Cryptosporidium xiaoi]|uniref:Signal peptide protein n=1 Tax=Cryptosporidium xiaoi TaxID=659607 RepID=A0AAV9XY86_9CRYT
MNENLLLFVLASLLAPLFIQKYSFVCSYDVESKNRILELGTYLAPPLDLLIGPYSEKAATTTDEELNLKLLYLLEHPDCWFNQRGKGVLFLFNETKFPEEYAILRKSKGMFSGKTKLEMDLQILEEEEDREKLIKQEEDTIFEDNILGQVSRMDGILFHLGEQKLSPPILSKLESSIVPVVNNTISEDIEKFNYKLRIRKLLRMKQETLNKIRKVNLELCYLNSSFIRECEDPECEICLDYQSSINLKYVERNKLRNRFKRVIGLLREFVDHSNKFVLEEELNKYIRTRDGKLDNHNLEIDILGQHFNEMKDVFVYKRRPGYNITRDGEIEPFDLEKNYMRLKKLLDEAEKRVTKEDEYYSGELECNLNKQDNEHCDNCKERISECGEYELRHLLRRREELKQVVTGVKFFLESLSERDCSKCNDKTFNGYTKFTDMIDTQMRTLDYYNKIGDKIDLRIDDCMDQIKNKKIILSDKVGFKGYWNNSFNISDEYSKILERIYGKYRIYNKSHPEFRDKLYKNDFYVGINGRNRNTNNCDINVLVLMNEYKKELVSRVVTNEIEMINLDGEICESCLFGSLIGCRRQPNCTKIHQNETFSCKKRISSIEDHLQYCSYDDIMTFRDNIDRNNIYSQSSKLDLYFGEDGVLWSLERYSSESFINRVVSFRGLARAYRLKILERIRLTLMTLIKISALPYSREVGVKKCKYCKYGNCNDCLRKYMNDSVNYIEGDKYLRLLNMVEREIRLLYPKISVKESFFSIKRNSLKYWKPREVGLMLKCDKLTYSRAYIYFRMLENAIRKNEETLDYLIERMLENADIPVAKFQLIDLVKEWDAIWTKHNIDKDAFKMVNGYLLNCIKFNLGSDRNFNEYVAERIEIEELNNSFRVQSKRIDSILTKLRETSGDEYIDFNERNYPDFEERLYKVNVLMQNLDNEFRIFSDIRRRLNSSIYKERFDNLGLKGDNISNIGNNYRNLDKKMIRTNKLSRLEVPNGILIEEFENNDFPIPGIRKYLEMISNSHKINSLGKYKFITSGMKSDSKYSCSKVEILVLQKITSVLSQNYNRLKLYSKSLDAVCKKECLECGLKRNLSDIILVEKNLINNVLEKSTIQLSQCILDTKDDFISKEEYIGFQNSLRMYLFEDNDFNSLITSRFEYIKNYRCDTTIGIKELINIKNDILVKFYPWIEKILNKIQILNEFDKNYQLNVLKYKSITYQFIQLVDYSKCVEEKINNCLSLLNVKFDHGTREN